MPLNQHNLSYEVSNHSTRVRIIISAAFTALEYEGPAVEVSMNCTYIPV